MANIILSRIDVHIFDLSTFIEKIKPLLETVERFNAKKNGKYLHSFKPEISQNNWEHTQSCLNRLAHILAICSELKEIVLEEETSQMLAIHDFPEVFAPHKDIDFSDPNREKLKKENNEGKILRDKVIELGLPQYFIVLYDCYSEKTERVFEYEFPLPVEGLLSQIIDKVDGGVFDKVNTYRNKEINFEDIEVLKDIDDTFNRIIKPLKLLIKYLRKIGFDETFVLSILNTLVQEILTSFGDEVPDIVKYYSILFKKEFEELDYV